MSSLLTLEEVEQGWERREVGVFIERKDGALFRALYYGEIPFRKAHFFVTEGANIINLDGVQYGETWRCWSRLPTDEQREGEKLDT